MNQQCGGNDFAKQSRWYMLIGAAQQKGVDLPSIKDQLNFRHTAADAEKKYEDQESR